MTLGITRTRSISSKLLASICNYMGKCQEENKDKELKTLCLPKALVLSGGGVKGLAYIGVLKKMEETGLLGEINLFCGCSIGAFACLLIILGFKSKTLEEVLTFYNMEKLSTPRLSNIINKMCLDDGKEMSSFIKSFIKNSGHDENITLKELYVKTGKILAVSATEIMKKKNRMISFIDFPDLKVELAVRISMNIPLVFQNIEYMGSLYCDGYISCNFPCEYIDFVSQKINEYKEIKPSEVLCICLDSEISSDPIQNIIKTPMYILQNRETNYCIDKKYNLVFVKIPKNINSVDFGIQPFVKKKLYDIGYDCFEKFFSSTFKN